jgi:membrane protein EpsK
VAAEPSDIPNFKNEFSRNLISNSAYFILNILIGLLIVPFYIDTLGIAAYGIIPLATSINSYVMIILAPLDQAISRFLTIHIQRSDATEATKVFNTSLFSIIALILIFTPIVGAIAWFTPDFFNIPDPEQDSVFFLFILIFFASFIGALQSPFSAVMYSFNKIHYINYIAIIRTLVTTCLIVAFLIILPPSVYYVGIAYFCSALFSLFLTISLSRKVYEKFRISIAYFSKKLFSEITTLAKWILVDQIGTLLLLQLSLILVNKELGTAAGGEYALVLIFFNLLWGITGLITSVLSPMYYTYFARGLFGSIHKLSVISVKCVGLVMALPIALICIFSPQLFTIWVGASFAHLSSLLWMLLVPMTMIVAFRPLILSYAAYNKVRVPAIVTILAGILNLILAVILTYIFGFGEYGIAFAFIFAMILRNVVFVPWYTAKVEGVPPALFYYPAIPGFLAFVVLILLGLSLGSIVTIPASLLPIILISGGISIIYIIIVTHMILTIPERKLIRSILPFGISKKLPRWVI